LVGRRRSTAGWKKFNGCSEIMPIGADRGPNAKYLFARVQNNPGQELRWSFLIRVDLRKSAARDFRVYLKFRMKPSNIFLKRLHNVSQAGITEIGVNG
jgi:hypothetical protein